LLDEAARLYEEEVPARGSEVLVRKAYILRSLFRYSDAEGILEEALEEAQGSRNLDAELAAGIELGNLRFEMGRYKAAKIIAREMLRRASESGYAMNEMVAWLLLGDIEHMEGEFDRAQSHFNSALSI